MQRLRQFLSYQAEIFSAYYTRYDEQNLVLDFYILATFQIKNNFPITDTRKIENYVFTKNIFFSFFSEHISQYYGYLVFSRCIWDIVKKFLDHTL